MFCALWLSRSWFSQRIAPPFELDDPNCWAQFSRSTCTNGCKLKLFHYEFVFFFRGVTKLRTHLSMPADSQVRSPGISKNKLIPRGNVDSRSLRSSDRLRNFSLLNKFVSIFDKSFNVSKTSKWVVSRLELRRRFLTASGYFCLNDLGRIAKKKAKTRNTN